MDKQGFIINLNDRLEYFKGFKDDQTIDMKSVKAMLGDILLQAFKIEPELPATESDREVVDLVSSIMNRFKTHEMCLIRDQFVPKLKAGSAEAPVPLTPEDIIPHVKIQHTGVSFSIVDASREYRKKTGSGLYEAKVFIENYASANRELLNKLVSEKFGEPIALNYVRF